MTLLAKIKADALVARKAQSSVAGVLVTLIGEIDTRTKSFSPARPMTDDEVVATVAKFIKNIDETMGVLDAARDASKVEKLASERTALEAYLPTQLDEKAIEAFVRTRISAGDNMGGVMAALKQSHAGQYDGKIASAITKRLLSAA